MRLTAANRQTSSSAGAESVAFAISANDQAHVMMILRDTLYSDKILAVLREYSANAWDANREAGRGETPIEVTLPTESDLFLRIRDHGPGLSSESVRKVFSQYGASTKRDSDLAVGMLGIGSKSAFAYADNFTVTSWHGGQKAIYAAGLDDNGGKISLLHEEACDPLLTGVEISIAVKDDDVEEFEDRARRLFQYMSPRPTINLQLPALHGDFFPAGRVDAPAVEDPNDILPDRGDWVAVMGCVPYRIDLKKIDLPSIYGCLQKLSGALHFGIGEVDVAASREELRYTDKTKTAIQAKFSELIDCYVLDALTRIEQTGLPMFERRLLARVLMTLELPLPDSVEELAKGWCKILDETSPIYLVCNGSPTNQVWVERDVQIFIDDTDKKISGYNLRPHDYVVRCRLAPEEQNKKNPKKPLSTDAVEAQLLVHLAAARMDGIKIFRLSARPWHEPWKAPSKTSAYRNKHRAKMFRYNGTSGRTYSTRWDIVERTAEATDVVVVIEEFDPKVNRFWQMRGEDEEIAKLFKLEIPDIYGYKSTFTKTVKQEDLVGVPYLEWRKAWLLKLLTPEILARLQVFAWHESAPVCNAVDMKRIAKALGGKHPIAQWSSARSRAAKKLKGDEGRRLRSLHHATEFVGLKQQREVDKAKKLLENTYPLLSEYGFEALFGWKANRERIALWTDYIRQVDRANTTPATPVTPAS